MITTDPEPEKGRLTVVLLTVGLSLLTIALVFRQPWSDGKTAALLGIVNTSLLTAYALFRRDRPFARLLVFGAVFGLVELVADALCVRFTGTLDYSPAKSPMILESPWWMPVAWMVVSIQIGYLGSRMIDRFGEWTGAFLTALLGAVNIPFYEEMARYANWWQYRDCRMLPGTHTPLYIILAELFIGFCLAPLAHRTLKEGSWSRAVLYGVLGGLSTIIGGLIGYGLPERVWPFLTGERTGLL
ncbi:MAG: hypothetical protein SFU56_02840 [Capsulimonadales bacterium]|nr:hypothetical protein [Capsulimonadales bacterium]